MMGQTLFGLTERRISFGKCSGGSGDPSMPFGGVNVVLFGDHSQLQPLASKPAYFGAYFDTNQLSEADANAAQLYTRFNHSFALNQNFRLHDGVWARFLSRLRRGALLDEDFRLVSDLTIGSDRCAITNFSTLPWAAATAVSAFGDMSRRWNLERCESHSKALGNGQFHVEARDVVLMQDMEEQDYLSKGYIRCSGGSSDEDRYRYREYLNLFIGMKVIALNGSQPGIPKGSRGVVVVIIPTGGDDREHRGTYRHLANFPVVVVDFDRPGYPSVRTSITPNIRTYDLFHYPNRHRVHQGAVKIVVHRLQLPIAPGYCFTEYEVQGLTLSETVVDLEAFASRPHLYLVLSRVRGKSDIRFIGNTEQFMRASIVDPHVVDELNRLEILRH